MAEGKKGIIVYADWMKKFETLSDDEAGRLIKHFFRYVNDLNPVAPDRITELSFIDIEQSLKRDLEKWETRVTRSRQNGKLGGRPVEKETQITQQVILDAKKTQQVILKPRKPDSVNDNDNVNDKESVKEKHPLENSNLFRKPTIPTIEKVKSVFKQNGGTEEQAVKFFDTHNSTAWFYKGSPITNFSNLVGGYITAWNNNRKRDPPESRSQPTKNIHDIIGKYD